MITEYRETRPWWSENALLRTFFALYGYCDVFKESDLNRSFRVSYTISGSDRFYRREKHSRSVLW